MRILFVTPYVPSSVRVRPYALIRELKRLEHRITLVCLVQPAWEEHYLDEVRPFCQAVHPVAMDRNKALIQALAAVLTRTPFSVAYCHSTTLDLVVRQLVESGSFDLVHTEFIRAVQATMDLKGLPKVYDAVDSLGLAYRRSLTAPYISLSQRTVSLFEALKMPVYEAGALRYYDRTVVSSPVDQQFMKRKGIPAATVLPNGVDLDYFTFSKDDRKVDQIVFLGKMSYYVNVASMRWFYKEVLSLVRKKKPEVQLKIVGRNPPTGILRFMKDNQVEVTGNVPDVRPYLAQAAVAICPMVTGSGIQNKLLEAMAAGTPCVVSPIAAQALQARDGEEMLIGENAQKFADCVLKLLRDRSLGEKLSYQARQYVERSHNWQAVGGGLDTIYQGLFTSKEKRDG